LYSTLFIISFIKKFFYLATTPESPMFLMPLKDIKKLMRPNECPSSPLTLCKEYKGLGEGTSDSLAHRVGRRV
jgi:hypothetical protein